MPVGTRKGAKNQETVFPEVDMSKLTPDGREIVSCIIAYFSNLVKLKDEKLSELEERTVSLERKVQSLESELDSTNAYERRDTLVMSGNIPEFSVGENSKALVRDILRDKARLNVDIHDLSVAHRIGQKPKNQAADKRNLIFKLCRRDLKFDILNACQQQRPDIYVNESLTSTRSNVMYILRKAREKHRDKISHCRTFDGKVTVFMNTPKSGPTEKKRKLVINTRDSLERFLREELKTTIEVLGVQWDKFSTR